MSRYIENNVQVFQVFQHMMVMMVSSSLIALKLYCLAALILHTARASSHQVCSLTCCSQHHGCRFTRLPSTNTMSNTRSSSQFWTRNWGLSIIICKCLSRSLLANLLLEFLTRPLLATVSGWLGQESIEHAPNWHISIWMCKNMSWTG